jgi:hypothetical protein
VVDLGGGDGDVLGEPPGEVQRFSEHFVVGADVGQSGQAELAEATTDVGFYADPKSHQAGVGVGAEIDYGARQFMPLDCGESDSGVLAPVAVQI